LSSALDGSADCSACGSEDTGARGVNIATPPADMPSNNPSAKPIFNLIIAVTPSFSAASAATRSGMSPLTTRIVAWINDREAASTCGVRAAARSGAVSDNPWRLKRSRSISRPRVRRL
jgi:hypothetical protein